MRILLSPRLIGTLAATAIAFMSFSAVPAYADDRRAVRTIATILGIAVVGKIIHDKNKDRKKERAAREQKVYKSHRPNRVEMHRPRPRAHDPVQRHPRVAPRPLPRRVDRKLLPQNCFRSYNTRNGAAHVFDERCLQRNYAHVNRMPQSCAQRIRTNEGPRIGYDARCLRRNGYSLDRG